MAGPTSRTGPHSTRLPGQAPWPRASRLSARRADTERAASTPGGPDAAAAQRGPGCPGAASCPPPRWPQQAWSWVTLSRNFQLPRPKGPQQSQARGAEAAAHAQGPRERCRPGAVPRGSPQAPWARAGPTCHLRKPQLAPSGANSQETFRDVPTSEKSGSTQPGLQLHVGGGGLPLPGWASQLSPLRLVSSHGPVPEVRLSPTLPEQPQGGGVQLSTPW